MLTILVSLASLRLFLSWLRQPYEIRHEYPDGTLAKREVWRYDFSLRPFGITYAPIFLEDFYTSGKLLSRRNCITWEGKIYSSEGEETDWPILISRARSGDLSVSIDARKQITFRPEISILERLIIRSKRSP